MRHIEKRSEKISLNLTIAIVTLIVNRLNTPIKR